MLVLLGNSFSSSAYLPIYNIHGDKERPLKTIVLLLWLGTFPKQARGVAFSNRQTPVSNQPSGEPQVPHYRVAEGLLGFKKFAVYHSELWSCPSSSLAA
jgi:hypothetical protein